MLTNLAPASQGFISRGDNLTNALGNFVSLLWLFNIDRLAGIGGRIVLYDVALVLPAYELQSLRLLLNTPSSGSDGLSVRASASRLLITQLQYNQVMLLCSRGCYPYIQRLVYEALTPSLSPIRSRLW